MLEVKGVANAELKKTMAQRLIAARRAETIMSEVGFGVVCGRVERMQVRGDEERSGKIRYLGFRCSYSHVGGL